MRRAVLLFGCALASGCSDAREARDGEPDCFDFEQGIQPVLAAECAECHVPGDAEGDYIVTSLAELFERRPTGEPRIVPGAEDSPFLTRARGEGDHPAASPGAVDVLTQWVVACEANTISSIAVHPRGWIAFNDPQEFHGFFLRDTQWDFDFCAECHGDVDDPGGGPVSASCLECHENGPLTCNTCHGTKLTAAPPPSVDRDISTAVDSVGAHRAHLRGGPALNVAVACSECHVVPGDFFDPGHVFLEDGGIDPGPAEVVFGELAARSLDAFAERRQGPPSYDPDTNTCSNVYCHGQVLGFEEPPEAVWTRVTGEEDCTLCHPMPPEQAHPPNIPESDCVECHQLVVNSDLEIVAPARHLNGALDLGETCSACHGSEESSAPPVGVFGETSRDTPAVGAHQPHVSTGAFANGFGCSVCHHRLTGDSFIERVVDPNHFTVWQQAQVFPGGADFPGLGAARGAEPDYDFDTATCSGAYCHGGGPLLDDAAPGIVRTLAWTGSVPVVCGSCHGIPPETPTHPQEAVPGLPITRDNCFFCHPLTVDASGDIIIRGSGVTTHIDGEVDL